MLFRSNTLAPYYAAAFVSHLLIFASFIYFGIHTDIQSHAEMLLAAYAQPASFPGNFLYYLVVGLLTGFSRHLPFVMYASCAVLAIAVVAKYHVTRRLLHYLVATPAATTPLAPVASPATQRIAQLSLGFLFIYSLPNLIFLTRHQLFYGHLTPNVWHNSTSIFLFPFALLLFWQQCLAFDPTRPPRVGLLTALVAISIFSKPSFFFVYAAVTPFVLLLRFRFSARFWLGLIPVAAGAVLLGAQFYVIFILNKVIAADEHGVVAPSGVALTALSPTLWQNWGGTVTAMIVNIPVSLVCGIAFPLALLAVWGWRYNRLIISYAIALLAMGCVVFSTVTEVGLRRTHGNFVWQNIICAYLVYVVTAATLLREWQHPAARWLKLLLAAHMLCGLFFLFKLFYTGSYT